MRQHSEHSTTATQKSNLFPTHCTLYAIVLSYCITQCTVFYFMSCFTSNVEQLLAKMTSFLIKFVHLFMHDVANYFFCFSKNGV